MSARTETPEAIIARLKRATDKVKKDRAALEASRVVPVSQKEAVPEFGLVAKQKLNSLLADGWAVNGYALIKGEERRGFIDFGGFVGWWLPEYYHSHTSDISPAPAGEPGIKALPHDLFTHKDDWRKAIVAMRDAMPDPVVGEQDDRGYWQHQLDTFDRMHAELVGDARIRTALHPTPTPVSAPVGVVEALRQLEAKAIGQRDYFNAKQRELPSIEDFTNEDGNLSLPADIAPLLRQVEANGRYSESSWWVATIQERIRAALTAPSASAQGGDL